MNDNDTNVNESIDTSNLTRWEDRTMADRAMDFLQTCDGPTLGNLALIGGTVLALMGLAFL